VSIDDLKIRHFHVLDAIEHAVGRANTEKDLQRIVDTYLPIVGLLNRGIEALGHPRASAQLDPLPMPYGDLPVYHPLFDPGAVERIAVLEAAVAKRAQQVPALAGTRLAPRSRRRGGCRIQPMEPLGDDPMSTLYCHLATGNPFSYRITIESSSGTAGATNRWAEIDSLRGNTWYECKCGYEELIDPSRPGRGDWRAGRARQVLEKLDHQVLNHVDIARTCGLDYRYVVSSERVAALLRARWHDNVVVTVVPFEGCD
jgi:hypothetical protein